MAFCAFQEQVLLFDEFLLVDHCRDWFTAAARYYYRSTDSLYSGHVFEDERVRPGLAFVLG